MTPQSHLTKIAHMRSHFTYQCNGHELESKSVSVLLQKKPVFLYFQFHIEQGLLHAVPVTLGSVGCTACGIATARILLLKKNPNKTNSDKILP